MRKLLAFAVVATLSACAGDLIRRNECLSADDCVDAGVELVDASVADAGASQDAGAVDAGQPSEDAGLPPSDAGVLANIDPICSGADGGVVDPPVDMLPPTVPDDCLVGFEMNDFHGTWSIASLQPSGSRAITLEVDIATYHEPDIIQIGGTVNGVESLLLYTCELQTWNSGDPTHGTRRPPDETIREFRVPLADGTTGLTFDFTRAKSPQYIRVLGLCDFDLTPPPNQGQRWRRVTMR